MEVLKNHSINGGDGVTWAYEVGDDAMVCPLIVEDLSTPGQMLIEVINCYTNQETDSKHIAKKQEKLNNFL